MNTELDPIHHKLCLPTTYSNLRVAKCSDFYSTLAYEMFAIWPFIC